MLLNHPSLIFQVDGPNTVYVCSPSAHCAMQIRCHDYETVREAWEHEPWILGIGANNVLIVFDMLNMLGVPQKKNWKATLTMFQIQSGQRSKRVEICICFPLGVTWSHEAKPLGCVMVDNQWILCHHKGFSLVQS